MKTRYTSTNGSQNGGLLGSSSEVTTPNGINGDIMLQSQETATLNNTNNLGTTTTTTTNTAGNINDYQLQQRSLKSKICRSLKQTRHALKFSKKYRQKD